MRRLMGLVTFALVATLALPAAGDIDQNPHAFAFGPGQCNDGKTFEVAVSPSDPSPFAKELTRDGLRGVAKAVYVTDGAGNAIATVFERPGEGLDSLTVRCWWQDAGSPTGYIGGDILFAGKNRR